MVSSCSGKVVSAAAFQTNKSMFNPQQKQAILMTCAGLGSNNPHKNVQIYFEQTNNRLHNLLPGIFYCNLSGACYITRINMKQISETYKFLVCTWHDTAKYQLFCRSFSNSAVSRMWSRKRNVLWRAYSHLLCLCLLTKHIRLGQVSAAIWHYCLGQSMYYNSQCVALLTVSTANLIQEPSDWSSSGSQRQTPGACARSGIVSSIHVFVHIYTST